MLIAHSFTPTFVVSIINQEFSSLSGPPTKPPSSLTLSPPILLLDSSIHSYHFLQPSTPNQVFPSSPRNLHSAICRQFVEHLVGVKMSSKGQSQNAFVRFITSPIRALGRARDFYVRSITKCGHNMNYSNPVDAAGRFTAFPRSYSVATSRSDDSEDFAELVRAASARTLVDRIDVDLVLKQHATAQQQQQSVGSNGLPKSTSVGMAKIDEDKPYDFADGGDKNGIPDLYPRSRSYAVRKRSVAF